MNIEKLSKINVLIQQIVFEASCNPKTKGKLNTQQITDICKEIVTELDDNSNLWERACELATKWIFDNITDKLVQQALISEPNYFYNQALKEEK